MKLKDLKKEYTHPKMRLVKAKAKELMLSGANHLTLIFSLVLIAVSATVPLYVFSLIYDFYPYVAVDIAMMVMEVLVMAPLLFGLVSMSAKMADGEACRPADLFEAFSDFKTYKRSLVFFIVFALILALLVSLVALPFVAAYLMRNAGMHDALIIAVTVAGVIATAFVSILSFCRMSIAPILNAKGESVLASIKGSFMLTKKKGIKLVCFALGFIPLVLISVVAVFVPMLIYTAPYLLCVWTVGAKMIMENNE